MQDVPSATKKNLLQLLTIDGGCVGDGVTMPFAAVVALALVVVREVVVVASAGPATQT